MSSRAVVSRQTRLFVLALFVSVAALIMPFTPFGVSGHSAPAPAANKVSPIGANLAPPTAQHPSSHPLAGGVNGTFYSTNSAVAKTPSNQTLCINSFFVMCQPQAQNPTVLHLANGHIGVGFSVITNFTTSGCNNSIGNTTTRIAFAISSDNGSTFATFAYIGDTSNKTCPYFDGLEPSFAVGARGEIFGAFVETNASAKTMMGGNYPTYPSMPLVAYTSRGDDALAFINSVNNGTSFARGQVLVLGNVAHPAIAAFGRSVYIVYENISNGSASLPGTYGGGNPVSINLVYSLDAGGTWHGPIALPGLGAAEYNTTLSPSIAVNSSGTLAVAYATNRSCIAWCGTYAAKYGYDIVAVTSKSNGSKWAGPYIIAMNAGESTSPYGIGVPALFEGAPTTSIAFGAITGKVYVAWSASYNLSVTDQYPYFTDWNRVTVFSSASSNNGVGWAPATMVPPLLRPIGDFSQQFGEANFNPGLGVRGGTVYLTYTYFSWTNGACGFTDYGDNVFGSAFAQYLATSPDGTHWTYAAILAASTRSNGLAFYHYAGYQASVAFATSGAPVIGYAMPDGFYYFPMYPGPAYQIVTLSVSTLYSGPTTTLTVEENGLTVGTAWTASIQGESFSSTAKNFTINNAPSGVQIYVLWTGTPTSPGYRTLIEPLLSQGPTVALTGPTTLYYNFTNFYGTELTVRPLNVPGFNLYLSTYTGPNSYHFYFTWSTYYNAYGRNAYFYYGGCPTPWYFPSGTRLSISSQFTYPVSSYYSGPAVIDYWNGTGSGSFTGSGLIGNITINAPINETMWMAGVGSYNATFTPIGLPRLSQYSFQLDNRLYSALGRTPTIVGNLSTGAHTITSITANSSKPGWKYFGTSSVGSPLILPEETNVNLSFAFVNLSASPGTFAFHAMGIGTGTPWRLSFNGTIYGSETPWINVTTRPGIFPVQGFPVVAANTSATFFPTGLGSNVSVSTGGVFQVAFAPVYRLTVLSSTGGAVRPSPGTFWLTQNATRTFNATAFPGFAWGGWSGSGSGSYTGNNLSATVVAHGPISESASFYPLPTARFNLSISEVGLPAGSLWTVYLNGVGYSSNSSSMLIPNLYSCAVSGSRGDYSVLAPYVYAPGPGALVRYTPLAYPATDCVPTPLVIRYTPEYYLSVQSSVGGLAQGSINGGLPISSGWVTNGSSVTLSESPYPVYQFIGWVGSGPGNYTGPSASPTFTPTGPVTELATFELIPPTPPARYSVTFHVASPTFASGTSWGVRLGAANYSSDTPLMVISGLLPGTYPVSVNTTTSPDRLTQYTPHTPPTNVRVVSTNQSIDLIFDSAYWVAIGVAGAGSATPSTGWVTAGHVVKLTATPAAGNVFAGWKGSGVGSYSGSQSTWNITVNNPIQETASFAPAPPAVIAVTSFWNSPTVWAGMAVVGVVVGVALGYLVSRRRVSATDTTPESWSEQAPTPTEEAPPPEERT